MPFCNRCQTEKPSIEMRPTRGKGLYANRPVRVCIACDRKRIEKWHQENRTRFQLVQRRRYLKKHYNLSEAEFQDIITRQSGQCAICFVALTGRIDVDHDHVTGKVRGLLCVNCNAGIGQLKDSLIIVQSAAKYLQAQR